MRILLQSISIAMLVLTVLFPVLYLFDTIGESAMKWSILSVTIIWFGVTPFWMDKEDLVIVTGKRTKG